MTSNTVTREIVAKASKIAHEIYGDGSNETKEAIDYFENLLYAAMAKGQQEATGNTALVEGEPWVQVGFLKEKLRQSEDEASVWKERAMSLRTAARQPTPEVEAWEVARLSCAKSVDDMGYLYGVGKKIVTRLMGLPNPYAALSQPAAPVPKEEPFYLDMANPSEVKPLKDDPR